MRDFTTYIVFDGNAREAMKFYADCLGADLNTFTFAESNMPCPEGEKNRLMHARLVKGSAVLMASDSISTSPAKITAGNNFSISINCESVEETESIFTQLSQGGKVGMPPQETFWAKRFAMFTDRFGINWMLNFEKPH